jgi:hypothetical protein
MPSSARLAMGKARPHAPVLGGDFGAAAWPGALGCCSVAAACFGGLVLKESRPSLSPEPPCLYTRLAAMHGATGNGALDVRSKSLDLDILMWMTKDAGNGLNF